MESIITSHTYNAGSSGLQFCLNHPLVLQKILYFSICSAIGQSFIFFTIANFDPLVSSPSAAEFESYSWSGRKETEQSRHDRRRKETEGRKDGRRAEQT
jgi:hypothetical protein